MDSLLVNPAPLPPEGREAGLDDAVASLRRSRHRLRWAVVLSGCGWLATAGVLIAGMVRYQLPGFVWAPIARATEPIPDLPFEPDYALPVPEPKLSFPTPPPTGAALAAWQQQGRAKLQELLAFEPRRTPPQVRVLDTARNDGIRFETLLFTHADGQEAPAFLLSSEAVKAKRAGLLVIPGHSAGIVATAGFVKDYQHSNALALAKEGYLVLTMEIRGFGYLSAMGDGPEHVDFMSHAAYALLIGRTALGIAVGDCAAALDYLQARPELDSDRLGLVGFSSGGKTAIYLAALDPRVRVIVASSCVTSHAANFRYARHDSYEALPGLANWLAFSDCMGLIAPRPMLVHWGEMDNKPWERCAAYNPDSITEFQAAHRIYTAFDAAERLDVAVTPGMRHEFDNAAAIPFLKRVLPPVIEPGKGPAKP